MFREMSIVIFTSTAIKHLHTGLGSGWHIQQFCQIQSGDNHLGQAYRWIWQDGSHTSYSVNLSFGGTMSIEAMWEVCPVPGTRIASLCAC
jgi:hypothetical protein